MAENVRRELLRLGLLRKDLVIQVQGDQILLPVRGPSRLAFPEGEGEFEPAWSPIRSYKEVVDVPETFRHHLPSSFDIIGDIAIVKLPPDLQPHEGSVGEAMLRANKVLKVVAVDRGVSGEFRVRDLRVIAGDNRTHTEHRERGLRFNVDVSKAYFSPRLCAERWRVTQQVKPGEIVLDLFAGVGPFAITIAKFSKASVVHAVDSNNEAITLLEHNVRLNRAFNVEIHHMDARDALRTLGRMDRIVMDLPHSAKRFLQDAVNATRPGGWIHYYEILEKASISDRRNELEEIHHPHKIRVRTIREVRAYSPSQAEYVFDLEVSAG